MREMNLDSRDRYVSDAVYMRKELLPALPGFVERTDGTLSMVYKGYLFEVVAQESSHSVAVMVYAPGPSGLLDKNVADLSFDLCDKASIVKAVGEFMKTVRSNGME